jgi:2-octaprenyl-6-methoxyphenol hydroxylase
MSMIEPARGCDIAIAGGSLTGLALARSLALALDHELRIAVIEPRPLAESGQADPRAYAISAGSKRMLDVLGVWSLVEPYAQPVRAIDITDSALEHAIRPVLLSYDNEIATDEPASWIVESGKLQPALLAVVRETRNVALMSPAAARAYRADDAGITIELADGGELRAQLLVAVDGRRSPMREAAGIKSVTWSHAQLGIVTTVAHERPHEGRAVQHFLPGGPFAILPLPGNQSCITWTEESERGRAIMALDDAGFLAEIETRFGHRLGVLSLAGPRASWPLEFHMARSLTAPRFALAGDAARGVHPIAGQGQNLGFRDVAALTQCIAETARLGLDVGDATGLERYERWRRFDSVMSAAAFDALDRLFSNDLLPVRTLRDAGLGLVDRAPGLKQAIVAEAAGRTGDVPRLLMGQMA